MPSSRAGRTPACRSRMAERAWPRPRRDRRDSRRDRRWASASTAAASIAAARTCPARETSSSHCCTALLMTTAPFAPARSIHFTAAWRSTSISNSRFSRHTSAMARMYGIGRSPLLAEEPLHLLVLAVDDRLDNVLLAGAGVMKHRPDILDRVLDLAPRVAQVRGLARRVDGRRTRNIDSPSRGRVGNGSPGKGRAVLAGRPLPAGAQQEAGSPLPPKVAQKSIVQHRRPAGPIPMPVLAGRLPVASARSSPRAANTSLRARLNWPYQSRIPPSHIHVRRNVRQRPTCLGQQLLGLGPASPAPGPPGRRLRRPAGCTRSRTAARPFARVARPARPATARTAAPPQPATA